MFLLLFVSSFFTFYIYFPAFSPMLRTLHQLAKHYYEDNKAPPMLYITDGGALDCTTLTQHAKRRTKRILMVLAAMDPRDELGVLRTAMQECMERKLCTFYDPKDPE